MAENYLINIQPALKITVIKSLYNLSKSYSKDHLYETIAYTIACIYFYNLASIHYLVMIQYVSYQDCMFVLLKSLFLPSHDAGTMSFHQ